MAALSKLALMRVNIFVCCKVQAGLVVTHKSVDDLRRQGIEGREGYRQRGEGCGGGGGG